MTHLKLSILAITLLAASCTEGGNEYCNLAANRKAFASTQYDYNLTAQLATDGIIDEEYPAFIAVSSSVGVLPRNEREWMFDWKTNTKYQLDGAKGFVRLDFNNYLPDFDNVRLVADCPGSNWSVALMGSEDGEAWRELDRISGKGSRINDSMSLGGASFSHLRLDLESDADGSWDICDWDFYKDGVEIKTVQGPTEVYYRGDLTNILPSDYFTSCWMSAGNGESWMYVDLGAECRISEVKTFWIGAIPEGEILFSNDNQTWEKAASLDNDVQIKVKARYIGLRIYDNEPVFLSEIQVFGKGRAKLEAEPQPEASGNRLDLTGGRWKLQRASLVSQETSQISGADFDDSQWLPATVPGTVLVSYLNNGAIPDPDYSDNQIQISESFFNSDFWYRDVFKMPKAFEGKRILLNFDGINWKADIFVNGKSVGRIDGAFIRGKFDVTELLTPGENVLAVRIIKNAHTGAIKEQTALSADSNGGMLGADDPTFHASVGWDWIPTIRGRNIGIWNDVYLTAVGDVTVENPYVHSKLNVGGSATVFVETELTNRSDTPVEGFVEGSFGDHTFSVPATLQPGETAKIVVPEFRIDNPKLWWPAGYGEQNLYDVDIRFVADNVTTDSKHFKSGVREMSYDESDGILKVYVNGRRFVGRGGNWGMSESNQRYREREYDAAVRYHADMNFTLIRNWVGQVGDDEFYEACDKYGVMVWQDFWLANPWDGPEPYDEAMFMANADDYVKRIRNHASMCIYCGRNEAMPPASLDTQLKALTEELHPDLHYISHSAAIVVSGGGPYRALPVKSYFRLYGNDRMHSERGMPCVMNYESLVKAMPEDKAWPLSSLWGLHDFTLESAQAAQSFIDMLYQGFGEPSNAREFTELAQWINYDGYRAIFEGRSDNRRGMLLWMSHPCWPSMVWQTYDYYLDPTAAYFACKKACEPIHIQYNPVSNCVEVVNYSGGEREGLKAKAEILSMTGDVVWSNEVSVDSKEDSTVSCFEVEVPEDVTDVYFIRLKLIDRSHSIVCENFYWKGVEEGNYRALRTLPSAKVNIKQKSSKNRGVWKSTVTISNDSPTPAMMLRVKAVDEYGGSISPAIYSDNYFFLMPGETKTVDIEISDSESNGRPEFVVSGFNI